MTHLSLIEEIREAAYDPDPARFAPWLAVSFARGAVEAGDDVALDYLKGCLRGHLWRAAPLDEAVTASVLWAASEELLLQTKRCRARRLSKAICNVVAGIIKSTWPGALDYGNITVTAQEGVSHHFLRHYGRADSDRLSVKIHKVGDLCHIKATATRGAAPTNRVHPVTVTSTGLAGARFLGAFDLDGARALPEEAVDDPAAPL